MKANTNPTPDLDEILLREVASHRSPSGSVLGRAAENGEHLPPQPLVAVDEAAYAEAQKSGYEATFLRTGVVRERAAIYVSAATKARLSEVVRRLGGGSLSLTTFAENILRHHLELFREQINRLHHQKNTHDIL